MQPLGFALALGDLRLAVARELAQVADRLGRHEVGLQQPGLGELAQPRRVGQVGLAARDLLDVTRVDQHQREVVLEQMPDRLPIHAGRFHHDLTDPVRGQPVAQSQQPPDRRGELRQMRLAAAVIGRHPHARRHAGLVDIERRDTVDDHVHHTLLARIARSPSTGACEFRESEERARAATVRKSATDPHAKLNDGPASAIVNRRPQTASESSLVLTRPEPRARAESN